MEEEPHQSSYPRDADGVGWADGRWYYGRDSLGVPAADLAATPQQRLMNVSALFDRQGELDERLGQELSPADRDAVMAELDRIQDALAWKELKKQRPQKTDADRERHNQYQRDYRRGIRRRKA